MAKRKRRKLKTWQERIDSWLRIHDNCQDAIEDVSESEVPDWKGSWASCQVAGDALTRAMKIAELHGEEPTGAMQPFAFLTPGKEQLEKLLDMMSKDADAESVPPSS